MLFQYWFNICDAGPTLNSIGSTYHVSWEILQIVNNLIDVVGLVSKRKMTFPVTCTCTMMYVTAIMHLYYARFVSHYLQDRGLVAHREPFKNLLTQGMVMGQSYKIKESGRYIPPDQVTISGNISYDHNFHVLV